MPWHDDILVNLPPPSPHGREPTELRRDILDELADHLDCDVRRELKKTDDESEARRAAAARFGDPKQIARRLWLDAMKEQLMSQRMMMGTQIVLAAMVIVLGVVVFVQFQSQRNQQAMLMELRVMSEHSRAQALEAEARARADREALLAKASTSFEWPTFRLQVVQADGKSGIAAVKAWLIGDAYNEGKTNKLEQATDAQGFASFGPMRPGGYTLKLAGDQGVGYTRSIIVPPGAEQPPLVIPWVALQPKLVQVALKAAIPSDAPMDRIQWIVSTVLEARAPQNTKVEGYWEWPAIQVLMDDRGRTATLFYGGDPLGRWQRELTPKFVSDLSWADHLSLDASLEYFPSHGGIWVRQKAQDEAANYGLISTFSSFPTGNLRLSEAVDAGTQAISLEPPREKLAMLRSWVETGQATSP